LSTDPTVEAKADRKIEEKVLVLPGHVFFIDRVELPEALESSEIDDFAELSLEGVAPFPIEQLSWGFLHDLTASAIILYATPKERLRALGYSDLSTYKWVLPDFATLAGAHFPEARTVLLKGPDAVSSLHFPKGMGLPLQIESHPIENELSGNNPAGFALRLQTVEVNERELPAFRFEPLDEADEASPGHWQTIIPAESELWRADVRDAAFKQAERNKRHLSLIASRMTVYAGLVAILLVLLEGLLFAGNLWLGTHQAKAASQAPEVARIEEKQSLTIKLEQVAQNQLRPIDILESLNQERPKGIHFTGTVAEGQNRVTVDGVAKSVNEFNAYKNQLVNSGLFELVEEKSSTRGGTTTFEVTLDYAHSANNEVLTPEPGEGEEG